MLVGGCLPLYTLAPRYSGGEGQGLREAVPVLNDRPLSKPALSVEDKKNGSQKKSIISSGFRFRFSLPSRPTC